MTGKFVTDLALSNLRRNRRAILPYGLSCIGMAMVFFIMYSLSASSSLEGIYGGRTMRSTLHMGVWVMGLFAVIFLFYTHSFLVKRRKQEFGLFNLLGMEKKHIARVLLVETFFISLVTTALGALLGLLFSKLMYLLILRMLGLPSGGSFAIPGAAFSMTFAIFLSIHLLTFLNTLRQLHSARPVELLRGGRLGEQEPKARLWLGLLGLVCLCWGYWMSISVEQVLQAIPTFLQAVLLVIVGTYLLFSAGTISLLKLMQKNKRFYYQPRHFSVVAGMRHRMKRNAVGLATVCILSIMVLVMVSAVFSLLIGRESILTERFPRQALISVSPLVGEEQTRPIDSLVAEELQAQHLPQQDLMRWRSLDMVAQMQGLDQFIHTEESFNPGDTRRLVMLSLVSAEDYAAISGRSPALQAGEALYFTRYGRELPEMIHLNGTPIRLTQRLLDGAHMDDSQQYIMESYLLVMTEADLMAAAARVKSQGLNYRLAFNTGAISAAEADDLVGGLTARMMDHMRDQGDGSYSLGIRHLARDRAEFNALYGGLLFVTIFLGAVFIMAMVLIIYYKQVSEGYEDRAGYLIMQQVGMSQEEVRQTIKSQVLIVFFLPLVMAGLHLAAAFNIVRQVLKLMALNDARLLILVCCASYLLFTLFYLLVYQKTARSYYRIVRA